MSRVALLIASVTVAIVVLAIVTHPPVKPRAPIVRAEFAETVGFRAAPTSAPAPGLTADAFAARWAPISFRPMTTNEVRDTSRETGGNWRESVVDPVPEAAAATPLPTSTSPPRYRRKTAKTTKSKDVCARHGMRKV